MDIAFRSSRLAKTFNSEKALIRNYGSRMARTIQLRLAVLCSAPTLVAVPMTPPDRRHLLSGDRSGQYAVDLVHPYRLIFEPDHAPLPLTEDGGIDITQVTAITIVEVTDYH